MSYAWSSTAEGRRLVAHRARAADWRLWGPYLGERQWGTVREDLSPDGDAWRSFPHDHARSRAYRWGEDGIAGISDREQYLCFAVALWNGNDPILKERLFGLAGPEGNHGEDVKEEYWYLESTPTHSLMRMRYAYPQQAFPYTELVEGNARRGREQPELEILDTGAFAEGRYFSVDVTYAKASEDDVLIAIEVTNRGPDPASCLVLPTLWFRNTWDWGYPAGPMGDVLTVPRLGRRDVAEAGAAVAAVHPVLGTYTLYAELADEVLFTDNVTNQARFRGGEGGPAKDAFHRLLVDGDDTAVRTDGAGTKAGVRVRLDLASGERRVVRLRLRHGAAVTPFAEFDAVVAARTVEADEFYAAIHHPALTLAESHLQRRALAGMMWSKQLYYLDVRQWLEGDPVRPRTAPAVRNTGWGHLRAFDVMSMPDAWEYPWFAAWDLAFHTVALALVDAEFAKRQLRLLTREWFMHPNGEFPAYEWAFGDANPPVHAWATWQVYRLEAEAGGDADRTFLEGMFHKLLLNFTWWVNRKDSDDNNVFEGGFLGLDNISVFNRSEALPTGGTLEQSDGTAWMAFYTLEMLKIALELARTDPVYQDIATKFFEHFLAIAAAMNGDVGPPGLWDDDDGFFHDVLSLPSGEQVQLGARSLVGLIPLLAVEAIEANALEPLHDFTRRMWWFLSIRPGMADAVATIDAPGVGERLLFSILNRERLTAVLTRMLDEAEFLSPFGIRSLSKAHEAEPYVFDRDGVHATIRYEPGETTSPLFGGNSNWRGPVWMPVNFLIIEALREYARYYGDDFTVEYPTGSGVVLTLDEVADAITDRLLALFLPGEGEPPPALRHRAPLVPSADWNEEPLFFEYFHGDDGSGLGASHQTGWTGLVAVLLARRAARRAGEA